MTRSRALLGALSAGCLALGASGPVGAQVINDITGQSSPTYGFASPFFELVANSITSWDGTAPFNPGAVATGPFNGGGFYLPGTSPFDDQGGAVVSNNDAAAPGEPVSKDSYLSWNVVQAGAYTVEIRAFGDVEL